MDKTTFTTKYIENYPVKYNVNEEEIAPQTYGIYWCMIATGMHRLFSKEHLHEFLFRLAITMESLQLVENWVGWDKFLTFTYKNKYYSLTPGDVFLHMGFEALDTYKDSIPRDDYLSKIGYLTGTAQIIGHSGGDFHVIRPEKIAEGEDGEEDTYQVNFQNANIHIDEKLIQKAGFFARDVLKTAPQGLFEKVPPARKEKMKELEERRQAIKNLPKFSLQMLSEDTIEQCMQLMIGAEEVEKLKQEPKDYEEESYRLIHLSWLFANELVWGNDFGWNVREGVELNEGAYAFEDGGVNLYETYEEYNMEACEELLKGVGF
jgi:hypothetical protein